jgi:formate hydrogenlyase subunit 6/NADH:ubiquinone oxidoreductase subunit I
MSYFSMSKLAFKWLFSPPATSSYPFLPRIEMEGSRGILVFNDENCVYCNVCAKKCPTGALQVIRAEKTLSIDRLSCITCGCCVEVCPKNSFEFSSDHGSPQTAKGRETYKREEQ